MKLKLSSKLAYGCGDIASNIIYQGVALTMLYYWTNVAMLSAAEGGMILLISRLFDGFTDVFFGGLVDKTNTKYGKARPWILYLALPFALASVITYWTPGLNNFGDVIYAFVSYNITMTMYTAINIPYGVLASKMTDDQQERGQLGILRSLASIIGTGLVALLSVFLIPRLGWTLTFLVLGLISSVFFLITFAGTKEVIGNDENSESFKLKEAMPYLVQNKPWLIMLFGGIIFFASNTIRTSSTLYYAQYIIGDFNQLLILIFLMIPGVIIGAVAANYSYKRIGKVKSSEYSCYALGIMTVAYYILSNGDPLNLPLLYAYLVLSAVVLGIGTSGFFAMIADTIEYGQWKTGVRIEGLTYSAASVGTKVGSGLGAAVVGWGLSVSNFDPTLAQQPASALAAINDMFLWVPTIMYVIFGIMLHYNEVDKVYDTIMKDLKQTAEDEAIAANEGNVVIDENLAVEN